jgi:5-formyltetrahydrofolate cyclo-ligase
MHLVSRCCATCNREMNAKADVRRRVRALLDFTPEERAEKSAALVAALTVTAWWREANVVALFAPQRTEPDLDLLWAHAEDKVLCYPRVVGEELHFAEVGALQSLTVARWALREPAPGGKEIPPEQIDLVLVPGLAFTRAGERLGRGGGYYDRFLAHPQLRAVRIGVCFEAQLLPELPLDSHDQHVQHVITDCGLSSSSVPARAAQMPGCA